MAINFKIDTSQLSAKLINSSKYNQWEKDVEVLQHTLYKIKNLNPILGGKWKQGMVRYYEGRLIELAWREPEKK